LSAKVEIDIERKRKPWALFAVLNLGELSLGREAKGQITNRGEIGRSIGESPPDTSR